ncbi:MAG: hypothetical protein ABIJ59_10215 [Pseudomonadota bacterium]
MLHLPKMVPARCKTEGSTENMRPGMPLKVIGTEYGIKPAVLIQYLVSQVLNHTNNRIRGFP